MFPRFALTKPLKNCQVFRSFPQSECSLSTFLSFSLYFFSEYKIIFSFFLKKVENIYYFKKKIKFTCIPISQRQAVFTIQCFFSFPNAYKCLNTFTVIENILNKYIILYTAYYVEQKVVVFVLSHGKLVLFCHFVP